MAEEDGAKAQLHEVNLDEINEVTGFKRAEEFIWNAFEKGYLNAGEEQDPDVDTWADGFCEQAEQDGSIFDRNVVKSVGVLGLYAGPRDEFQQRSGSGKAIYANGDRYEGEFFEGKKHGSGQYIWVSKGKSEVDKLVEKELKAMDGGSTSNNAGGILGEKVMDHRIPTIAARLQVSNRVVEGILEYGFVPCYHGDYIRGKRTGQGIMKNKDATLYKGEFLENKREGQGLFYYLNGDVYSGHWKADKKHGYGTYHFAGGGEYRGEWLDGIFSQGQWILPDGTYYEGKFDKKNRPQDSSASMHYPATKMAQKGVFKRGVWAPTSAMEVCEELPVDGMAWHD